MPDHMDHVQDAVLAATEAAIAKAIPVASGRATCMECGAAIGDYRQALGAQLCLMHQHEAEQARSRASGRGRRP